MLRFPVESYEAICKQYPNGKVCQGDQEVIIPEAEATFALRIYPMGHDEDSNGSISIFIRCLSLKNRAIKAVEVNACFKAVGEDGCALRVEELCSVARMAPLKDKTVGTKDSTGRGKFWIPGLDKFCLTCDISLIDIIYRESTSRQVRGRCC